jgi:outer membrane lipoprotein carrier protein
MTHPQRSLAVALFSLALGLGVAARGAPTHAQDECDTATSESASATCVAAWAQSFVDARTTIEARFQQYAWTRVYERTQTSRGTLRISRPGHIRFDYTQPSGQVLVSDGTTVTFYQPTEGGAGQYYRGAWDSSSAALGFLTGTSRLQRDFTYTRITSTSGPPHTICLELHPRTADPHYTRIRLYVSDQAASRGAVLRVAIEDHDGNWNTFAFSDLHFDRTFDASTFAYTPPAGAHEISPPASSGAPSSSSAHGAR